MKTTHIYQIEILKPEYTDLFHCHIEFETVDNGLRCDVTLVDNKDPDNSLTIATAISKGYDMAELHDDAINLLSNQRYCSAVLRHHTRMAAVGSTADWNKPPGSIFRWSCGCNPFRPFER